MELFTIIKNAIAVIMASTLLAGGAAGTADGPAQAADTEQPAAYHDTAAGDGLSDDGLAFDISGRSTRPWIEEATRNAKDAAEDAFEKVTGQPPFTGGESGSAPAPSVPDTATGGSWEDWGESVGDSWESWGESYGDSWGSWGDSYGDSWESWGESVGDYFDRGFDF